MKKSSPALAAASLDANRMAGSAMPVSALSGADSPAAVRAEKGRLRVFAKAVPRATKRGSQEEALRQRNVELERYRLIVDNLGEYGIGMLDEQGRYITWGGAAEKQIGWKSEEVLGRYYDVLATEEDCRAGLPLQELEEAARTGRSIRDCWKRRRDGSLFWASGVLSAVRDEAGKLAGYVRVGRDMTAQKRIEAHLDRYRMMVQSISDDHVVFTLTLEGLFDSWSPGAQAATGYKAEDVLGREYGLMFPPAERAAGAPRLELDEAARRGSWACESWRMRENGCLYWSSGVTTAIRDETGRISGFVRVARDMTGEQQLKESLARLAADLEDRVAERTRQLEHSVNELRRKNNKVQELARITERDLEEKKLMLNEIHHRVKNNLQVVQSLLKMSVRSLPDGEARTVTMNTAQRVYAMAMVHERLYQTKDLAGISVATYARDLFAGVTESNSALEGQIRLKLDADEILLNLDQAIPFGLMVNELLCNSLKHGFPEGRKGIVRVSIHRGPGGAELVVKDDGIGLPENFNAAKCKSLGLKLAASLAHQLGGELTFKSDNGCRVAATLRRL